MESDKALRNLWIDLCASLWLVQEAGHATKDKHRQMKHAMRKYRKRPGARFLGAGRALVVRDLAEFPADNWARYYPAAKQTGFGAKYLQLLTAIQTVQHAWGVAHAFEAFERYSRTVAALVLTRDKLALNDAWRDLRRRTKSRRARPRSFKGWLARIEASNPRLHQLWRFACARFTTVGQTSVHNNRALDLADWLQAVDVFRQAAVHTDLIVVKARWAKLSPRVQAYLRSFKGRGARRGFRLTPDERTAEEAISILGECGYVLYRGLADGEGKDPRAVLELPRGAA